MLAPSQHDRWPVLPFLTKIPAAGATVWQTVLDMLYPPRCVACGRIGSYYCRSCREDLHFIDPPVCFRCGRPLTEPGLCHICRRTISPLDGARSVLFFGGSVRFAIHALKYRNMPQLGRLLGAIMTGYIGPNSIHAQIIMPVPLHPERLKMRGYNQSALLALEISRHTSVPINGTALIRHRHTRPQTTLHAQERWENVAGAFSVPRPEIVAGKRIVLIDDVMTTGATLKACAQALKAAGAASVWGFTLARARRKPHVA